MATTFTLHTETVKPWLLLSRLHILFRLVVLLLLFYYRITHLFQHTTTTITPWILMTISELIISVLWLFTQAFRWRPVTRSVMTEKLPGDTELPRLDIFVCTLDPEKEPTVDVVDTVVSAIAMDYPPNKLAVYLSDDGACPLTLYGIREASEFAKVWLPFCRKYGIKSRCPKVFFSPMGEDEHLIRTNESRAEQEVIKVYMFLIQLSTSLSKIAIFFCFLLQ